MTLQKHLIFIYTILHTNQYPYTLYIYNIGIDRVYINKYIYIFIIPFESETDIKYWMNIFSIMKFYFPFYLVEYINDIWQRPISIYDDMLYNKMIFGIEWKLTIHIYICYTQIGMFIFVIHTNRLYCIQYFIILYLCVCMYIYVYIVYCSLLRHPVPVFTTHPVKLSPAFLLLVAPEMFVTNMYMLFCIYWNEWMYIPNQGFFFKKNWFKKVYIIVQYHKRNINIDEYSFDRKWES